MTGDSVQTLTDAVSELTTDDEGCPKLHDNPIIGFEQQQQTQVLVPLRIRVNHGCWGEFANTEISHLADEPFVVEVPEDESTTVLELKQKIAAVVDVPVGMLYLEWMNKPLGRVHMDDTFDESQQLLSSFSVVRWFNQFPEWTLTCKMQPLGPVDPYVAIKKTVALQMGKDPEEEVAKARADGSLYHIDNWEEHKQRYNIIE